MCIKWRKPYAIPTYPTPASPKAQVAQSSQSCLGLVPSSVSPCTMMGSLGANSSKAATVTPPSWALLACSFPKVTWGSHSSSISGGRGCWAGKDGKSTRKNAGKFNTKVAKWWLYLGQSPALAFFGRESRQGSRRYKFWGRLRSQTEHLQPPTTHHLCL